MLNYFLNYGFRFLLMTAWLGLIGLKISYFLTEPTTLLSRLDHTLHKLPYISVLPSTQISMINDWNRENSTEKERRELFGNQTLLRLLQIVRACPG